MWHCNWLPYRYLKMNTNPSEQHKLPILLSSIFCLLTFSQTSIMSTTQVSQALLYTQMLDLPILNRPTPHKPTTSLMIRRMMIWKCAEHRAVLQWHAYSAEVLHDAIDLLPHHLMIHIGRKLKCDGRQTCANCNRRGIACTYSPVSVSPILHIFHTENLTSVFQVRTEIIYTNVWGCIILLFSAS